MRTYAYVYCSYKKGKPCVYLYIKLKVSGAHAPLGPTVDTPLTLLRPELRDYSLGQIAFAVFERYLLSHSCFAM